MLNLILKSPYRPPERISPMYMLFFVFLELASTFQLSQSKYLYNRWGVHQAGFRLKPEFSLRRKWEIPALIIQNIWHTYGTHGNKYIPRYACYMEFFVKADWKFILKKTSTFTNLSFVRQGWKTYTMFLMLHQRKIFYVSFPHFQYKILYTAHHQIYNRMTELSIFFFHLNFNMLL